MSQCQMPIAISPGSLGQFIQAANQAPYLTLEEEKNLATRLRDHQDTDAARQLILSHLRYVVHVARNYAGYGLPMADLVQEGAVGLMKAVSKFDVSRGVRLVSFAAHWVRAEIHEYVLKNWSIVKVATTKAQRKLFFNLRSQKEKIGWLPVKEAERIAENLHVDASDVMEMDGRLMERNPSYDSAPENDDDNRASPADYLAAPTLGPSELAEETEWEAYQHEQLSEALSQLDDRSRDILEARWLAGPKIGLKELGEKYGVSAERIRQLENQAIKKLRTELVAL